MMNLDQNEVIRSLRNRTTKLEREGDYWTNDEKRLLEQMFEAGEGISAIAITLQRTEPAVCQQIEKMDLYGRKRNPQRRQQRTKPPVCLCEACQLDMGLCPRSVLCVNREEAARHV